MFSDNLVIAIWQQLVPHLPEGVVLHCLKLYETPQDLCGILW